MPRGSAARPRCRPSPSPSSTPPIGGWLAPGAVVVVEEAASVTLETPPVLSLIERSYYGETQVGFYQPGQSVM